MLILCDPYFVKSFGHLRYLNSVTQVPAPLKWEDQLVKQSMEYNLTAATVRLFEERPIWAKPTLLDRLAEFGVVIADAHVKRCVI